MILKNLTFNEYFELEDKSEYDFAIKYGKDFNKPNDLFEVGDFTELAFKTIKDLQYYIENGLQWIHVFELIESVKGTNQNKIGNKLLIDLCRFKSFLVEEIYRINKIESTSLAYNITSDEENAGIEDLSELGSYLQFRQIATTFSITPKEVGEWKYSAALLELVAQKRINEYQSAYIKIKSKK